MTRLSDVTQRVTMGIAIVFSALWVGRAIVVEPGMVRLLVAACIAILAVVCAIEWPRRSVVAMLLLLPFLALIRRLLLDFAGWQSTDPLLLVGPAVVALLIVQLFVFDRRAFATDWISRLVLIVLGLSVLQVFNPRGGSVAAGAAALLFTAVPMCWFFVGREYASDRIVRRILVAMVGLASAIAVYGLWQTWNGLPPWDAEWVKQSGYAALSISDVIRAFGTFSSAAEYAYYLGIAIIVACSFALTGKVWLLPSVPLLAIALFYESSRGIIVTTIAALVVVVSARTGNLRKAAGAGIASLALLALGLSLAHGALAETARTSSDPLVSHQLTGLTNPFNEDSSTLPIHLAMLENGFRSGVLDPFGHGIASVTSAGDKLGTGARAVSTEVDVSNAFVGLGTIGGAAYLGLVLMSLWAAFKLAVERRDAVTLSCLGALVCAFGQWWNGGFYAVAPLLWFIVGYVVAARTRA